MLGIMPERNKQFISIEKRETTMETIDTKVIQTQGLSKAYKGMKVLDRLNLGVPRNSIFGFLGPNGAGKSMTIKLLLGIAFGIMFGGMIAAQLVPQVSFILPLSMDQVALSLAQAQALPAMAVSQLVMTAVWSIVFTAVALWRFKHIEF